MSALYGRRQVLRIAPLKWRVALREHYARATKVARGAQSVKELKCSLANVGLGGT